MKTCPRQVFSVSPGQLICPGPLSVGVSKNMTQRPGASLWVKMLYSVGSMRAHSSSAVMLSQE